MTTLLIFLSIAALGAFVWMVVAEFKPVSRIPDAPKPPPLRRPGLYAATSKPPRKKPDSGNSNIADDMFLGSMILDSDSDKTSPNTFFQDYGGGGHFGGGGSTDSWDSSSSSDSSSSYDSSSSSDSSSSD
jgi:hypothetical protein